MIQLIYYCRGYLGDIESSESSYLGQDIWFFGSSDPEWRMWLYRHATDAIFDSLPNGFSQMGLQMPFGG